MNALPTLILAWRPFLDPIDANAAWFLLLLPLALGIAVAYKAVRAPDMTTYWRQTALFALQIIGGIVGLYAAALVFLEVILPRIV